MSNSGKVTDNMACFYTRIKLFTVHSFKNWLWHPKPTCTMLCFTGRWLVVQVSFQSSCPCSCTTCSVVGCHWSRIPDFGVEISIKLRVLWPDCSGTSHLNAFCNQDSRSEHGATQTIYLSSDNAVKLETLILWINFGEFIATHLVFCRTYTEHGL